MPLGSSAHTGTQADTPDTADPLPGCGTCHSTRVRRRAWHLLQEQQRGVRLVEAERTQLVVLRVQPRGQPVAGAHKPVRQEPRRAGVEHTPPVVPEGRVWREGAAGHTSGRE